MARSDGLIRQKNVPRQPSEPAVEPLPPDVVSSDRCVRAVIVEQLSMTAKIPLAGVDVDVPFSDYGIDSILNVGLVSRINKRLGIELNSAIVFDHTTVNRLAHHIFDTYGDRVTMQPEAAPEERVQCVRNAPVSPSVSLDIAVVGMSGQFPGAGDVDTFWQQLLTRKNAVGELPANYLNRTSHFSLGKQPGKSYCKWGGVLADRDCFDPLFFNISPGEAESMNPHQRLVLQESWKALEDAGYNPKSLAESAIGLFIGAEPSGYAASSFTGLSDAIVASRLSYYLDLNGPAMVVNTGCSSSAVAIHLACESLRSRESRMALAGGVYAAMDQDTLVRLSQIEMLSPTGRCHVFDASADGIVLSEGVGIVVLKRLEDAVADADTIYGVIQASGLNQDGASNGITAPSGTAQEKLIRSVYERFQIDPARISYVEAHGTGTKLGDPVEANALVRSFAKFTDKKSYCRIGSVKSHIGHTAAAAGVISLIKLLMSFKHRVLPGMLHFNRLNPLIDFDDSAFTVNAKPVEWESPDGEPLTAAINSFGHSGTNVHFVIREHLESRRVALHSRGPVLLPLSARTEASLSGYAKALSEFLSPDLNLADVAYTLQTGREAMEQRAIFLAASVNEFIEQLRVFQADGERVWIGQAKRRASNGPMIGERDLCRVAMAWSEGADIDWTRFYRDATPRRIRLPAYRFARERYWKSAQPAASVAAKLHPLLHENCSTFAGQRFVASFSGQEFFFADHVVRGQHILPAMAHLEMARAALARSSDEPGIQLKHVVWAQPLQPGPASIDLTSRDNGEIAFEIRGGSGEFVCSRGWAVPCTATVPPTVDLSAWRSACSRTRLAADTLYDALETMGFEYGPRFRGLQEVFVGSNQAMARLDLPAAVSDEGFMLHPGVLDAAIQSVGSLISASGNPPIPFALEKLEWFGPCSSTMWALVQQREATFDVDLCDSPGNVQVRLTGLSMRSMPQTTPEVLLLHPVWHAEDIAPEAVEPEYAEHRVVLVEPDMELKSLESRSLRAVEQGLDHRFATYALKCFEEIQELMRAGIRRPVLFQLVIPEGDGREVFFGINALFKTAHQENPGLFFQTIGISSDDDAGSIEAKLRAERRSPEGDLIRYKRGRRQVAGWAALDSSESPPPPLKDRGIYLMTGGAGGIGLGLCQEIRSQFKNVTLVLAGRSPRHDSLPEGAVYRRVDVTRNDAMTGLIDGIMKEFGALHGIIHAAGITRDNFILQKSRDDFQAVMAPKVTGLVQLDEASKDLDLDFFVLFSSLSAPLGNPGQADYACANGFMDGYARYRNRLVAAGRRQGHTVSINWPFWKAGGMGTGEAAQRQMRDRTGLVPMSHSMGLAALARALHSGVDQVIVLVGELNRIETLLAPPPVAATTVKLSPSAADEREQAESRFKKLLSPVLGMPANRIDAASPLEKYGIDSIVAMKLTVELEKTFGPLPKTLFFEYQNIRDLTKFFLDSYRDKLGLAPAPDAMARIEPRPTAAVTANSRDIAIIGLSGRYPQARTLDQFWENLREGRDCLSEIPADRWDHARYFSEDPDQPGKTYSKWGGFIDGIENFDPLFFQMSPKEASLTDPQERLFLQCVYETIEDAGYTRASLRTDGKVGVYVGVMYEEYPYHAVQESALGRPLILSGSPASIANRVSYFCDFHGPSMAVDTMCSSSLSAIHLACESLRQGECVSAIAGGVNLSLHPNKYLFLGAGKFVSSKGRCESFGRGAEGYVPGEGVGAVLLKPLSKAIADGDHIYGVIKATAINHGGKTNGYTVPNPNAQGEVVREAYERAGIDPRTITYLEAHGTGTSLGDPIEIAGLRRAFMRDGSVELRDRIGEVEHRSLRKRGGHRRSDQGVAAVETRQDRSIAALPGA